MTRPDHFGGETAFHYDDDCAILNLTPQDEQVAFFANTAAHLAPGGRFVVEVGVPDPQRLPVGERLIAFDVSDGHVGVDPGE